MENLKQVEQELTSIINLDKKNWTHFYLLLKEVEDNELWRDEYHSFTQWVKDFAIRSKTHESIIWNRKKAGQVYLNYVENQRKKGIEVPEIQNANVSADSLVLLDKINKYNPQRCAELVDKVMNKGITKKDLREVYKSVRPQIISKNPHLKQVEQRTEQNEHKITASEIVTALCSSKWLGVNIEKQYFKTSFEKDKYKILTEFPVHTGTSRKSRRVDVLIVENLTTQNAWELNLHGVEIKVSKSDLLNDTKYSEYAEFVDYLWLAIPEELAEIAKDNTFAGCGIIIFKRDGDIVTAKVGVKANKLNALRREDTLTNLVLKSI